MPKLLIDAWMMRLLIVYMMLWMPAGMPMMSMFLRSGRSNLMRRNSSLVASFFLLSVMTTRRTETACDITVA